MSVNQIEAEIKAITHSINYCKQRYEKETKPEIKQKIQHYIDGLEKELEFRLELVEE